MAPLSIPTFYLYLGGVCALLGLVLAWRTLLNANRMDRRTPHLVRLLNLVLLGAAVAMVGAPLVSLEAMSMAMQFALVVFVICSFIGRRPTDRVLGG